MPTIFLSDISLGGSTTPDDVNDGFDTLGLGNLLAAPAYSAAGRTLQDVGLVGNLAAITAGMFVAVTGGTGWTAGLYELESVNDGTGTIVFKAGSGVNVSTNDAPTLSTGPLATLTGVSGAMSKFPTTPTGPWTSYTANAAVRLAIASSTGNFDLAATWQWNTYATAAYHHQICGATAGGVISATGTPPTTLRPGSAFTTGTSLFETVTGTSAYYLDIVSLAFNGSANAKTALRCVNLNQANGDIVLTNCRFTAATGDGFRTVSSRTALSRCRSFSNGQHGFYNTSSALNNIRLFACEASSNTADGFNVDGSSEGVSLVECVSHNNGSDGFEFAASNRSPLVLRCTAAANAQHGFNLGAAVDAHLIGNVSTNNGSTSSHRQYSFGATTAGTRALNLEGNVACAAGSTVVTDATDTTAAQILAVTTTPIRNTSASAFDARLTGSFRAALRSLIRKLIGVGVAATDAPGLGTFTAGGAGGDRVLPRS